MNIDKFLEELSWFSIKKLSNTHDLKNFSCGKTKDNNELDLFLKEDALKQQEQKINVTHVAVLKNTKKVIGYVTTLNDKLRVNNKEKKDLAIKANYSDFPSVKIGRLAVDTKYSNKQIATTLLRHIIGLVLTNTSDIGCRFLIVDSYPESVGFYLKKGFILNLVQDQTRTKILDKNTREVINKTQRETISLRFDLLNK
ncbi:MAG: GNAT family N-acetyltransferase [Candidatus ainarchaeum sp.]|nr:GNAT family N-acetyltransferase [Candidatus ainarchaeum sp.]